MPENKCPLQAVVEWTRGASGGTHNFHFSVATLTILSCFHGWVVLLLTHPSHSSSLTHPPHFYSNGNDTYMGSNNQFQFSEKSSEVSCHRRVLGLLDASFFNDTQIEEIDKGANEFNIPIIKANRKLVASENGGLRYPSPLVFNADWDYRPAHSANKRFNYPSISGIQRPESEEDIAFMSVLELSELIKTKQITSQELTQIFLRRLKKYNPILEVVVTYTDELAHREAKEADELLSQGVYLGPLHGIPYGLKDIISVPGYRTTWGSKSFKNQVINKEAWVYKR